MISRSIALLLALVLPLSSVEAGARISAAGLYRQSTRKVNASGSLSVVQDEKDDELSGDVLVGYRFPFALYLGAIIHQTRDSRTLTTVSKIDSVRTALGASAGLLMGGWIVLGHYYLTAKEAPSLAANQSQLSGGSGFQFDFGYAFAATSHLRVGPEVVYRQFSYNDYSASNSAVQSVSAKQNEVRPQLVLAIEF